LAVTSELIDDRLAKFRASAAGENAQVGRHPVLTNPEGVACITSRRADLSGLDEQAEYIEPRRLAESWESVENVIFIYISRIWKYGL
tara:strand:+ start:168 stop:428 length:261 start_codon:yes stop_codon:yes gene_type:complete